MSPELVEAAALRVRWLCAICAGTAIVSLTLQRLLQPEVAGILRNPVFALTWLFLVLVSIGVSAVHRLRLLTPPAMLTLGLVFEVMVAFAISLSETAMEVPSDRPMLGIPALSMWILVVGLLVPNRPIVKLVVALISASTFPLAYFINLYVHDFQPLTWNRFLARAYFPYLTAVITFALARRMFTMERAVQKANDLGSYQLVSPIGSGGMGEVWRARHRMLARDAAIKLMRSELAMQQTGRESDVTRARFQREARVIASLQCPHTVYLFDFGVTQDGSFYYVMELLDGVSLELLVDKFGPQPASRVAYILRQVCESLEEAHRRGLIHRDIKPSNILLCALGLEHDFAKVLDFGLAKELTTQEARLTIEGTAAGTPAYMAPEVAMGDGAIDGRADLYSLGCVAYFLLTGENVFEEKTPTATALAHVQRQPVPPSQRSEMPIPPDLDAVVLSCLAKKPEDRPASARELARRLAACQDVGRWTQDDASEWWQTYLPVSSSYRIARQTTPQPTEVTARVANLS
jgi:serine/threonine-protein kinase